LKLIFQSIDKIIRILAIPYSGLLSILFGIMLLSFPIGLYVMFNSDVGRELNYQYPLEGLDLFFGGIGYKIPISFEMGDVFIFVWAIFLILFSISYLGPEESLMKTLSNLMSKSWRDLTRNNALANMITWFSIMILFSIIIEVVQQYFGIKIEPPPQVENELIHFFQISIAPLTEEVGFRVFLIGVPLFLLYSHKASWKLFFKSLWKPSTYLHIGSYRKIMVLIIMIGLLFGFAHIISGSPWSLGKFLQAAVAGIIIGWVYVRYGLAPAVLIHWATNYLTFSYLLFISNLSQTITVDESSNFFSNNLETIIVLAGILSLVIKILALVESKKNKSIKQI
jgi:hypothetical protein